VRDTAWLPASARRALPTASFRLKAGASANAVRLKADTTAAIFPVKAAATGAALALVIVLCTAAPARAQSELPALADRPVNDFAGVIDQSHARTIDAMCRELKQKTGDTVFVVTVKTIEPWGDIREYAVKLFEKQGLGERGKDNGLLVLLAVKERRVRIEVGYGLEPYITDGFAGETSRQVMVPFFRQGDYGGGLAAGVARLVGRLAQARDIEITGAPPPSAPRHAPSIPPGAILVLFIIVLVVMRFLSAMSRFGNRRRRWGRRSTWSGWHSGVGPFGGGGFGGGFGGFGGGGGGFGGFGGGRSGGGGGGASW
jgi:uncharacterized protein